MMPSAAAGGMVSGPSSAFGSLQGLRVIELGQLIAGPFCGQLLADHGAEVIKIEDPKRGDPMREWGQGKKVWWPVIARNKKAVTLNLREQRGQEVLKRLVKDADFLIENFRPGTMEKWGLGPDVLEQINPRLIIVRVSGYGQTGPYAQRAGYGSIGEAMGGMRYLAGDPSLPPSRIGLSIGDSLAASFACLGALMALERRHKTGRGQVVDSAIYEAVLAMMESTVAEYTEAGHIRERTGSVLPGIAPSNVYPTKDGEILIGANQDSVFIRLCSAMEAPEIANDPKFSSHSARGVNQAELDQLVGDWTARLATAEVLDLLNTAGVPAGNIFRAPEMMADPQFQAREALVKVAHPEFPKLMMQNVFPKLSDTPGEVRWAGSAMGEHNEEIYSGLLGLSSEELAQLKEDGII